MVLMVLTGLAGVVAAWALPTRPAWFMLGFEALVALTGVLGLAWLRGGELRRSSMALACVAGVCLLMSLVGYLSVKGQLGGLGLKGWLVVRGAMSALVLFAAAAAALDGHRDLWRMFARGGVCALVLLAGAASAYAFRGAIASGLGGIDGLVRFALGVVALGVIGGAACYAGHVLIRAFQIAEERKSGPGSARAG